MINFNRFAVAAAVSAMIGGMSVMPSAHAETRWQANHPRRTEVNGRLGNQDARIHNKVADGQMTHAQAAQLHNDDHQIRQEERDMASQNGSHITGTEDRALNQQENAVSHDIHNE